MELTCSATSKELKAEMYTTPQRRIITPEDLEIWKKSQSFDEIVTFITDLSNSVIGKTNDAEGGIESSPAVQAMMQLLEDVLAIIKKHPVKDKSSSRFGKPEFRDVYDEINYNSKQLIKKEFGLTDDGLVSEISVYLNESFGNRTRIDYGSGHELNFLVFLYCLFKQHTFSEQDLSSLVLKVFNKYIRVMRILQKEYWLEPAGSHGVWGLDDYHFLPFLFGASQLSTHKYLKPKSIHNVELMEELHTKYMYFECIWFLNQIKTASLRWHSPMLDDISAVKKWEKVAEGMIKMYKAEVLGKLPIIQHLFFGSILKAPEGVSAVANHEHTEDCHHDHDSDEGLPVHQHTWGDCCGIKIPSAFAASESNNAKIIPFD